MIIRIMQAELDHVLKRKEQYDILEINKLRRQLLFLSRLWDERLVFIVKSPNGLSPKKNIETGEKLISFTTRSESTRERESKNTLFSSVSLSEDSVSAESNLLSRRTMSDGHFPTLNSINDVLGATWMSNCDSGCTSDILSSTKESTEANGLIMNSTRIMMPFSKLYDSWKKFNPSYAYKPLYITVPEWLGGPGGLRIFLPVGVNDLVIPVLENEPTSVISYALASRDYHDKLLNGNHHEPSPRVDIPLPQTPGNISVEPPRRARVKIDFAYDGLQGRVCYSVVCYYPRYFNRLRIKSCISEQDFIRSLSRCKNWKAHGGKSNVFFAKSLDDRFVIKQVTRIELESFLQFGPAYFKYVSDSIGSNSPSCLAKIYGIYQVMYV
jgi:1-phosphatidylinositol-3-phosphate 5-kinase